MSALKPPAEYVVDLQHWRVRRPLHWPKPALQLERFTNRHRETDGQPWGWYEVTPIGVRVGYWGNSGDELAGVDVADWNRRAEELSK